MIKLHCVFDNLDEDLKRAADTQLGPAELASDDADEATTADPTGNAEGEVPHYRNRFTAVRAAIPYRPLTLDGQGRAIHPKPTTAGSQSAIVIGAGDVIHTDRDHRIKVQNHWQRGANASTRLAHPAGDNNAPASHSLGAWLRVAASAAGANSR